MVAVKIKNIYCPYCGQKQTKIKRENSENIATVCTNSKCSAYINMGNVRNWKQK